MSERERETDRQTDRERERRGRCCLLKKSFSPRDLALTGRGRRRPEKEAGGGGRRRRDS